MQQTSNISLANLTPQVKSQLKKKPWQKRRQMDLLIDQNIGKFANITVRPYNTITLLARLHKNHKIQVNAGWIQAITILSYKENEEIEKQIDLIGKEEKVQEIEEK